VQHVLGGRSVSIWEDRQLIVLTTSAARDWAGGIGFCVGRG
jgi:hypothetical protein